MALTPLLAPFSPLVMFDEELELPFLNSSPDLKIDPKMYEWLLYIKTAITIYLDSECWANSMSVVDLFGMNLSEQMRPGDLEDPLEFPPVDERSRRLPVLPLEPDLRCCLSELLALAATPPPPKSAVCSRDSDRERFNPLALNCFAETLRALPPPLRPTGRLKEDFCTLMEESRRRADWISASKLNWDMAKTVEAGGGVLRSWI